MYREKMSLGFRAVAGLAIINAILTIAYFVLLNRGILNTALILDGVADFALSAALAGVLPMFLGVVGLTRRKMWGLACFTLGNGAYFFAGLSLLKPAWEAHGTGVLFFTAVYLLLFSLLSHFYTWSVRYSIRDY